MLANAAQMGLQTLGHAHRASPVVTTEAKHHARCYCGMSHGTDATAGPAAPLSPKRLTERTGNAEATEKSKCTDDIAYIDSGEGDRDAHAATRGLAV